MACHCVGCQKMTASAFSLTAIVPQDGFETVEGDPVIGGRHGAEAQHFCCPFCMSWLFTRAPGMSVVNVRSPMLEGAADFMPYAETYICEKLPFAQTGAPRRYDMFPQEDEFDDIKQSFGKWIQERRRDPGRSSDGSRKDGCRPKKS